MVSRLVPQFPPEVRDYIVRHLLIRLQTVRCNYHLEPESPVLKDQTSCPHCRFLLFERNIVQLPIVTRHIPATESDNFYCNRESQNTPGFGTEAETLCRGVSILELVESEIEYHEVTDATRNLFRAQQRRIVLSHYSPYVRPDEFPVQNPPFFHLNTLNIFTSLRVVQVTARASTSELPLICRLAVDTDSCLSMAALRQSFSLQVDLRFWIFGDLVHSLTENCFPFVLSGPHAEAGEPSRFFRKMFGVSRSVGLEVLIPRFPERNGWSLEKIALLSTKEWLQAVKRTKSGGPNMVQEYRKAGIDLCEKLIRDLPLTEEDDPP